MGGVLYWSDHFLVFKGIPAKRPLGQLYLGVFSGPVEGILMIIAIFLISGFKGKSCSMYIFAIQFLLSSIGSAFWDTGVLTFLGLDTNPAIAGKIPNIGLNESFMVFGAFGLAFNIISRFVLLLNSAHSLMTRDFLVILMSTRLVQPRRNHL